jgi:ribosomal protein S12 methylthiotransferase accessory factor
MVKDEPHCGTTSRPQTIYGSEHKVRKSTPQDHRVCSVAETFATIRPVLSTAGITRLANITGLDRIGIPVTLSIRPNSRGVATNAGKGLTLEAALVSAAMESLERVHAERATIALKRVSYRDVRRSYAVIPGELLPCRKGAQLNVEWPHDWIIGWDLLQQCECAVPFSMVSITMERSPYDFPIFQSTCVGLAAGNNIVEAIAAGLLELVEHDSTTCYLYSQRGRRDRAVVDIDHIPYLSVRDITARLSAVGIRTKVIDCTTDTEVPVYEASLYDEWLPNVGVYRGQAAHLDPEIAIIRALLEAIQSRCVYIAGSRDDYTQDHFRLMHSSAYNRRLEEELQAQPDTGRLHQSRATANIDTDIAILVESLKAIGMQQIIVVDLSRPADFPISVAKMIVPGLEGWLTDGYVPGRRALRSRQCL